MNRENARRNPLSPRNDYFFKRIFGDARDKEILTDFLKAAIEIPAEEYDDIEIVDPASNAEHADDKCSVLDIKVRTKSGKTIGVEIQRYSEKTFRERIVYQVSKLIEEQISIGDDYCKINAVICIVITEFSLINENDEYHNRYVYHDGRTGSTFSDISAIHVFELTKLPPAGLDGEEPVLDWLRFIDSDEVNSMEAIAEKNEGVRRAVAKYKELTASERERMIAESIAKERRIRKSQLDYALDQGIAEGINQGIAQGIAQGINQGIAKTAKQMRLKGLDAALISEVTGLSEKDIEEL
jgi:predicted transposase/invertase (TIGR01784 family)